MFNSFVDSNLWVYALVESEEEKEKRMKIFSFLERLRSRSTIMASVQVLNEFHWILKRKYKVDESVIRSKVANGILEVAHIIPLDLDTYKDAYTLRDNYSLSFWDSLIVSSALQSGCRYLYTEDMQHQQKIEDKLEIFNPFQS
jgi:predicted nucleic acid-binding protein